ncbi:uncharacterized protein LOC119768738 [Culex quinquefasciatus]|uniref:uncharacterized protein LOC119768738 n=1 Tax=Culex quinquefasciatus TaxID=7176 RepID=UPI0018E2EC9F|nr:uncharacterized protein LOC119768738 [Culex quinquefasciatus]
MEVEDSSDDDFLPVVGTRKRKKTSDDGADVGNGNEEQHLNNNKFSTLVENNNNNNGNPAEKGSVPPVPVAKKPPPLVVKNMSFGKLRNVMLSCTTKPSYKLTPFGIKLLRISEERFKVEFYTHEKRSERQLRVVVRGLPPASPEFVKKKLKESHNLDAVEVNAIKRKGEFASSAETPYVVTFPKGYTNHKKLSEIKLLKAFHIRWEAYRNKRTNVTQCRNCLQLGH